MRDGGLRWFAPGRLAADATGTGRSKHSCLRTLARPIRRGSTPSRSTLPQQATSHLLSRTPPAYLAGLRRSCDVFARQDPKPNSVRQRQRFPTQTPTYIAVSLSLNARFEGEAPSDPDDPHPPGAGIARALEQSLRAQGFAVGPLDNWRDAGWVIGYRSGHDALDVALAATGPRQWMLQVAPREVPGLLASLFGRRGPDRGQAIYDLARAVTAALAASGFGGAAWRWDGPPRAGDPPVPPPVPAADSGPPAA